MFNMRKDIKKSSYYVWFLGAQEAKGFRGAEFVVPVIAELVEREREVEPYKVTLQASYKGLKIIRNIPQENPGKKGSEPEVIKHFIPHQAITCVYREEDVVACILLLYNPVTKCPLHVHVYRCDSVETAAVLASQLQTLVDRPDNQKKLAEIEGRLKSKGRARDSESSGGSLSSGVSSQEKIASLYDSLAAELKEKLGTGPILLPPRDYDTVHRRKGDLTDIENRRCLNASVVGRLAGRQSPCSSGIGSDKAPSPDRERHRYLERPSSSDEEWASEQYRQGQKNWSSNDVSLPRPKRVPNENLDWKVNPTGVARVGSSLSIDGPVRRKDHDAEELQLRAFGDSREEANQRWPRSAQERQRTPSPAKRSSASIGQCLTARERFQDAKEKFLSLERNEQERMLQIRNERRKAETSQNPVVPVFRPHLIRSLSHSKTDEEADERLKPSYSSHDEHAHKYLEEMRYNQSLHAHNTRNSHFSDGPDFKRLSYSSERDNIDNRSDDIPPNTRIRHQYVTEQHMHPSKNHRHRREKGFESEKPRFENAHRNMVQLPSSGDMGEDPGMRARRQQQQQQQLQQQQQQQRYYQEEETPIPLQRYRSPERIRAGSKHRSRPGLYPSRSSENIDDSKTANSGHLDNQHYQRKQADLQAEKKRRSLYESVQDERKRNSNELAKEFMKRSFQDQRTSYKDLKEQDHFSHSERDLNRQGEDISGRYRHSYVEPVSRSHDHVQRASSAVSPQRVGIAAIHPY